MYYSDDNIYYYSDPITQNSEDGFGEFLSVPVAMVTSAPTADTNVDVNSVSHTACGSETSAAVGGHTVTDVPVTGVAVCEMETKKGTALPWICNKL